METTENLENQCHQRLHQAAQAVGDAIEGYLSHDPAVPEILREAMLYSLRAGGKRLRPVMAILACEACGGQEVRAQPAAAALEMIHTYSLIHDDLPAMDNDDMRRGQPTNHKVFGDGVAVLAGDALLTYAFNILARHIQKDALARQLVLELSDAAGAAGMIGGQIADLQSHNQPRNIDNVEYIHTRKTALMFRAAARMGAWCADADPRDIDSVGDYGLKLGLAFQVTDDLLDITGTTKELGKNTGKDEKAGKLTYPAVVGLEESQQQAYNLIESAIGALDKFGPAAEPLRYLARMITNRKR
jgi:geranylgeranyl diphosphate synthase type II